MRGTVFFGLGSWQVWHPAVAVGGQVGRVEVYNANHMHPAYLPYDHFIHDPIEH